MTWILFSIVVAIAAIFCLAALRGALKFSALLLLAIWVTFSLYLSIGSLENRKVGVVSAFGSIELDHPISSPGLYFIAPYKKVTEMEIKGHEIDVATGGDSLSLSADKVPLTVHVSLPYALNPAYAPHVLARLGDKEHFEARLLSSAQTALRDTVASMPWADVVTDKRTKFEQDLLKNVRSVVAAQLTGLGFNAQEAMGAFTFLPLQVKQASPPKRIADENAENAAADIGLARQKKLTEQAREIATRRQLEGTGIKNMLAALPIDQAKLTENGIANIINAQAHETEALAMKAALENGKVQALTIISSPANPLPISATK